MCQDFRSQCLMTKYLHKLIFFLSTAVPKSWESLKYSRNHDTEGKVNYILLEIIHTMLYVCVRTLSVLQKWNS